MAARQGRPETIAYLEAENAYTEARTAHLAGLRETIFEEIRSRTQETDLSVPVAERRLVVLHPHRRGQAVRHQLPRAAGSPDDWAPPRLDADTEIPGEQVLLDGNELAEGHDFFSLGASDVSPDGRLLALAPTSAATSGSRCGSRTCAPASCSPDEIPDTAYGTTWAADGRYLFYTTVDEAWRPDQVWRHRARHRRSDDVVVYHEADERFWVGVGRTRSDRFLVIDVGSKITTEYRVLAADDPTGESAWSRRAGRASSTPSSTPDRRRGPVPDPAQRRRRELHARPGAGGRHPHGSGPPLIEHDPAVRLEAVDAFAGHLVVCQRSDGLTGLRVIRSTRTASATTSWSSSPSRSTRSARAATRSSHQPTVRLGYTSLVTPAGRLRLRPGHPAS